MRRKQEGANYRGLGRLLTKLRCDSDLTQEQAVASLDAPYYYDERTLRHYESGDFRMPRAKLLHTLIKVYEITDVAEINRFFTADHIRPLFRREIDHYKLSSARPSEVGKLPMPSPRPEHPRQGRSGIPAANVYIHPNGRFQKKGDIWKEHRNDAPDKPFTFKELWRDHEYIYLCDETRLREPGHPMLFRIPILGGTAQWTFPDPIEWEDCLIVKPQW